MVQLEVQSECATVSQQPLLLLLGLSSLPVLVVRHRRKKMIPC